jgi:hypothetical protein
VEHEFVKSAVLRKNGDAFPGDWSAQFLGVYDGDVDTALRMKPLVATLRKVIPDGSVFIAIDDSQLKLDSLKMFERRQLLPFPENDGRYAGRPSDDATAVANFERLRAGGARFLVIFWPAFWWLDRYADFARHIKRRFARLIADDRMIVFDLTASPVPTLDSNTGGGIGR